jgi:hypothetical protein
MKKSHGVNAKAWHVFFHLLDGTLLLCDLIVRKISGEKYNASVIPNQNITLEVEDHIVNSINTFDAQVEH